MLSQNPVLMIYLLHVRVRDSESQMYFTRPLARTRIIALIKRTDKARVTGQDRVAFKLQSTQQFHNKLFRRNIMKKCNYQIYSNTNLLHSICKAFLDDDLEGDRKMQNIHKELLLNMNLKITAETRKHALNNNMNNVQWS